MRLFFAVELPPGAVAAATAVAQILRQRLDEMAPRPRLAWVAPDRMHVTVRFLGEVDAVRARQIADLFKEPLESGAFPLTLGSVGAFPPRGSPRALWVAIGQGAAEMRRLEEEVSGRLDRAGFPREPRPFSPHLTLARVRDGKGIRQSALIDVAVPGHREEMVDTITLFESRLSSKGPTYTALQRISLHRR